MTQVVRALASVAVLLSANARAWPVDLFVDVPARGEKFVRFEGVEWVDSEDPKIATAEAFPSGEVMVSGGQPGTTLLMVYGQGRFSVWKIRVAGEGAPARPPGADPQAVRTACPKAEVAPGRVVARVASERCRLALRAYLEQGDARADGTDLTFELEALQAQLRDLGAGLAARGLTEKVKLRYLGAGLVLEGAVTAAEHRQLLWEIFRRSAGRAALEDRLEVAQPPAPAMPDAGAAPP